MSKTLNVKSAPAVAVQRIVSRLIDDVPTNWLDPLLSGSKAVIDHRKPMFTCADIERLFNALRERMRKTANVQSSGTRDHRT